MSKLAAKFLGESLLFLEWSVSLAMAKAMKTGHNVTAELALNANIMLSALTTMMAVKAAFSTLFSYLRHWRRLSGYDIAYCIVVHLIPIIFATFFVALKVYTFFRADYCPQHAWGNNRLYLKHIGCIFDRTIHGGSSEYCCPWCMSVATAAAKGGRLEHSESQEQQRHLSR